jgi:hypothetical protein
LEWTEANGISFTAKNDMVQVQRSLSRSGEPSSNRRRAGSIFVTMGSLLGRDRAKSVVAGNAVQPFPGPGPWTPDHLLDNAFVSPDAWNAVCNFYLCEPARHLLSTSSGGELRKVTIVYARAAPSIAFLCDSIEGLQRTQKIYELALAVAKEHEGAVIDLFADEKGVSMVLAFGLPPRECFFFFFFFFCFVNCFLMIFILLFSFFFIAF